MNLACIFLEHRYKPACLLCQDELVCPSDASSALFWSTYMSFKGGSSLTYEPVSFFALLSYLSSALLEFFCRYKHM